MASSERAQAIVDEFKLMLEKSQQLFAGLRDLPQFGRRQWQPYFQKTFEVYTRLWKYQQTHRAVLEGDAFGLRRWQIGEIASKIGQLYYHFYLRSSEGNYLLQAHQFYHAIRQREYFRDIDTEKPGYVVKKLRFYARYLVVCLLLNETSTVRTLRDELRGHIDAYVAAFRTQDTAEWSLVLNEIDAFLAASEGITDLDGAASDLRLAEETFAMANTTVRLGEAVLVGGAQRQVKFSELTLDVFRMLQVLEHKAFARPRATAAPAGDSLGGGAGGVPPNPHKYLLYRPTFEQLLLFLATASKELPPETALFLYLSGNGVAGAGPGGKAAGSRLVGGARTDGPEMLQRRVPYGVGGVSCARARSSRRRQRTEDRSLRTAGSDDGEDGGEGDADAEAGAGGGIGALADALRSGDNSHRAAWWPAAEQVRDEGSDPGRRAVDAQALYPEDLLPFTRKPLFAVVDASDHADAFGSLTLGVFGAPVVVLASPSRLPLAMQTTTETGSLFTWFLTDPLGAFQHVCAARSSGRVAPAPKQDAIERVSVIVGTACKVARALLLRSDVPAAYTAFAGDPYLRTILERFLFANAVFLLHADFQAQAILPVSHPALPDAVLHSHDLLKCVLEAAAEFQASLAFGHVPTADVDNGDGLGDSDDDGDDGPDASQYGRVNLIPNSSDDGEVLASATDESEAGGGGS